MAQVSGLSCLRCGAHYPLSHYTRDCDACRPGAPSNLVVRYQATAGSRPARESWGQGGLWRYGDLLPFSRSDLVSLGEGGTPLHALQKLGAETGLSHLYAKDETRNPTGSFKDRLACMAISSARAMGAKVIVSSSSGNAGAAAAAYAAKAGLPCVVFTFKGTTGPMLTQMLAYGAHVLAVENKKDRWTLMQAAVDAHGWFPTSPFFGPAVGSNPLGIEGYKTLAYEIAEQLDWQVPDWCVLPICYGDALVGMWRGFSEMLDMGWTDRMPRMVAAEVYGSLARALQEESDVPPETGAGRSTRAVSIGAAQGTYQALDVVRRSGGAAIEISDEEMLHWKERMARREGLYIELSSAAAMAAAVKLRASGQIRAGERVVLLHTATGLKDAAPAASALPMVAPDLGAALAVLKEVYGFSH
jgi:threonine synthase